MRIGPTAASFDQRMMALLVVFSSSEPARAAAAAWLDAFDRARANGVAEAEAQRHAASAWDEVARVRLPRGQPEMGSGEAGSGMLARSHVVRPPPAARPPPDAAGQPTGAHHCRHACPRAGGRG